jgi:uncharacterized membrane protein YoaK (UPF0700 family)
LDHEQSPAAVEVARLPLGVTLTALAGFVDAVAFVRLKGLFVSFMSGNSTQLAALPSLGRTGEAEGAAALVLLFVMGAFAGRLIGVSAGAWRRPALLVVVATLLFLAAATPLLESRSPGAALGLSAAAMTLAMGMANSVLRKAGDARVTATYVTGVLVNLGHALADAVSGQRAPWMAYLLLWLGLVCGAAVGALMALQFGAAALLAPSALSGLLALVLGVWVRRDLAAGRTP